MELGAVRAVHDLNLLPGQGRRKLILNGGGAGDIG